MILSKIKVVAAGSNRTRFINKLKDENIAIYDLVSEDKSVFWIKHNDFKVVKKFADVYSIQLEIKDNGGFLKILHNTYKHLPYMIAATICLIFLFASTAFVYNIQVDAQNDIYANKVHTFLKENNYGGIVAKNKIDLKAIENLILTNVEEVSFATCYIEGFSLMVKIVASEPPKVTENQKDLISDYDGVVTRVIVRSGTSEVKVGERVKAGDILIGGYHIRESLYS